MNSPSAFELKSEIPIRARLDHLVALLRHFAGFIAKLMAELRRRHGAHAAISRADYQLGRAVHHPRFGSGQVLAHWPDGRFLVKFERSAQNQLIFPAQLQ